MASSRAGASAFQLRKATLEDIPQLRLLIDSSVRSLQKSYYTPAQISGSLKSVYGVDTQLIEDGNYFVVYPDASPALIVGCGGWSHRSTLYGGDQYASRDDSNLLDPEKDAAKIRAFFVRPDWVRRGIAGVVLRACEDAAREAGFKRAEMGATLSGVPFYESMGYVKGKQVDAPLGDGMVLEVVRMGKELM